MVLDSTPRLSVSPLGPIPPGWQLVHLKDITTKIGSGATPHGGESVYLPHRQRFALIRSQNVFDRHFDDTGLVFISDEHAAQLQGVWVRPGDVLLNITGDGITFARSCLAPTSILPACVNQHVAIIRPNQELGVPGYVLSYLTHPKIKTYIESFNAGGSRRAITKGHIESFLIPLPPLPEQRVIASILGSLDDKIELNRRMNETLEETARAIFRAWFVDFEPVRAKAAGRTPQSVDAATAALFPDSFEVVEGREVPRGWRLSRIGNILELAYGRPLKEEDRRPGKIPVYGSNGQIGWHNSALVGGPGIIVGRKGNPGIVTWSSSPFYPIDTTFYVAPRDGIPSLHFLFYMLQGQNLSALAADSAVPGLNRHSVYENEVVAPSAEVLEALDQYMAPIRQKEAANDDQMLTLIALRDALLPKLLSGELRMRDAEQVVEEQL